MSRRTPRLVVVAIAADGTVSVHAPDGRLFRSVGAAERWASFEFGPDGTDGVSWSVEVVEVALD